MSLENRARAHAALGDPLRLRIVDALAVGDHTVAEIAELTGTRGNLLAHHLHVLDDAGLIERQVSEGDRRRRYVTLRGDGLPGPVRLGIPFPATVAFVCTHNSARSQFAAAMWSERTGTDAVSAGSQPAPAVHPLAVRVAAEHGVDLSRAVPAGYERLPIRPELVISVCDRARESDVPAAGGSLHWSIPDPVPAGRVEAFRDAFTEIGRRIDHFLTLTEPGKANLP